MANRVTQAITEVLGRPASAGGRATGVALEVLGQSNDPGARATGVMLEVLSSVGAFRMTEVGAQVAITAPSTVRITEVGAHIVTPRTRGTRVTQLGVQVVTGNPPPVEQPGRGFWVCAADATGTRLVGTEELLTPGPWEVEYPRDSSRPIVETAAATAIKQQPAGDPRMRTWIWRMLPTGEHWLQYDRLIHRLETLLGSARVKAGLPEIIWVKDDVTAALRKWSDARGTVTAASVNTLTDDGKNWPTDRFRDGTVEIIAGTGVGQRRGIVANDATTLYLGYDWDVDPALDSEYRVRASRNDWVQARVLNVPKIPSARATVEQHLRFEFVVIDPLADDWG